MNHQQIAIEKNGAADRLVVRDALSAPLRDDEVSIAVSYSGVNFADIQMRLGFYPDAPKKPFVPGYEVSGHIAEVGKNVEGVAIGDPVLAGTFFGGYASRINVPAVQALPLPKNMDLAQGAAIPVSFFTSHIALFEMARLRAGDRVLIEGATGGVGTIAVQMARHVGAEVVGLTTSKHKLSYIEELGAAAHTRDEFYRDESITGFDFILNASGGSEVKKQMKRLRIGGRMVCIGLSSGLKDGKRNFLRMAAAVAKTPRLSVLKMFDANAGVFGLNALRVLEQPEWVERLTEAMSAVETMDLVPHVGKIFAAEKAASAHEFLQTKQAKGKVLLSWT